MGENTIARRTIMIAVAIQGTKVHLDETERAIRDAEHIGFLVEGVIRECTGAEALVSLAPELDPEDEAL